MTIKQFFRIFQLNPRIYLDSIKRQEFENAMHRIMQFNSDKVIDALNRVIARDGNEYPRLWYVKCVFDVLLAEKKREEMKIEIAPSVKDALRSLFT